VRLAGCQNLIKREAGDRLVAGRVSRRGGDGLLILFTLGVLAGSIATSHAAGRIEDRSWLLLATALHQAGAGVWIGGLLALLLALSTVTDKAGLAFIGPAIRQWRYSVSPRC
jgi:copper resistance protein D